MATFKKCIFEAVFSMFPQKNIALVELHSFEITISKKIKTTSRVWFPLSRAQHPAHRIIRFFRSNFSKTHIFPNLSRPGQPTKKTFQPWLLIDSSKNKFPKECQRLLSQYVSVACIEMRQVLQTWTGERWNWILSMFKQKK